MSKLLISILFFMLGNILIWFQTNGQFLWKWFEKQPITLSLVFGGFISYFFIFATKYAYHYFDALIWPGKFVGFSTGIICYAVMTYIFMNEGMTLKTIMSLALASLIILIQVFWK